MLGGILWVVVWIITGAAVLVAAALGAAWYLAREINAGHERTCGCPNCQRKRQREWRAAQKLAEDMTPPVNPPRRPGWAKDHKPPPNREHWRSTYELTPGMRVIGRNGALYMVDSVEPIDYGFMVVVSNAGNGKKTEIPVPGDKAHQRIWLIRDPKRRD